MNQLLPIIRRVRRPLLAQDAPPVMVGNVEVVEVGNIEHSTSNAEQRMGEREENPPLTPPAEGKREQTNAEASSKRKPR